MKPGRYAAVVLAAGVSRRMGEFKPLLPLGEATVVNHVIDAFRQNGVAVYLVVGWRGDELRAAVGKRDVVIIENAAYRRGMFTSVLAGVRGLPPAVAAFFVMPVDIPLVRPATISRLLKEAESRPGKIIYPAFGKKRGHPPLVPSGLASVILGWGGGGGLKAVLATRAADAVEVLVPDANILFDIDTRRDYKTMLRRFGRYGVPTDEECDVILDDICRVAPKVRRHSDKVAEVAVAMGQALRGSGCEIDLEIIWAAARLHDLAKGQPQHDAAGGRTLREMGFGVVGDIVAMHSDIPEGADGVSLEAKVVFLADKFVQDTSMVTIEERYRAASRKYGLTPEIVARIKRLELRALEVKRELEGRLGYPLEEVTG